MKTSDFRYDLPNEAIAQAAIEPRHAARLLDTRDMGDHRFLDLPSLLEPGDMLVVNRTRVRRARMYGRKDTGGAVEVLLLRALDDGRWEALARPTRRLRVGSVIRFDGVEAEIVTAPEGGRVVLRSDADLGRVAEEQGEIPLPPYFHGSLPTDERYQTVFAERLGSAAAPTASLHFTDEVVDRLGERGVGISRVELEVGLDTFRPIATEQIDDHEMHSETIHVDAEAADAINAARHSGGRVVAVGTTVVRTLESAWRDGRVQPFDGATDLFITPGYAFGAVDLVLTNFHVPGSTLVVLVASLLGDRWREVYAAALARDYRFLSFGDAMLAEVPR
jgi:S-adenosylmethionine:tRNA ribosyltransferase-isomerase